MLGAPLLTAFVGSVIGFTQTSGCCPLWAGEPEALWKSPARSGAEPEVPWREMSEVSFIWFDGCEKSPKIEEEILNTRVT